MGAASEQFDRPISAACQVVHCAVYLVAIVLGSVLVLAWGGRQHGGR